MKDCNGVEIQVGDTIQFESGVTATVMLTSALFARIKVCKSGTEESIGFLDRINFKIIKKVEVISKSNQSTTPSKTLTASPQQSLVALKAQAREEIQEVISKYTSLINAAGGTFGVHVSLYDARTMNDYKPEQLVDVNITVTI